MKKSRTGKKIARAIALGLATMVTLTSVPVTATAEEGKIKVEDLRTENTGASAQKIDDTENAEKKSEDAESKAEEIASDAKSAADAADSAMQAADNASDIADAAEDLLAALTIPEDGSENLATQIAAATDVDPNSPKQNAVVLYNAADNAINNETTGSEALIAAANDAISDANSAINGEKGSETALTAVNTQVQTADNAIKAASDSKNGSKNEDGSVKTPGTDALIKAAADKLDELNAADGQLATDRTGVENERKNLQKAVNDAVDKYGNADKTTQGKINNEIAPLLVTELKDGTVKDKDGKVTDSITKNISDVFGKDEINGDATDGTKAVTLCKDYAEGEKRDANAALSNTWGNYYGVKRLVDNGSHDVIAAQAYAKNARTEADKAQQAADNAKAFAAQAVVAETNAKANLKAAEERVAYYEEQLRQALAANEQAYDDADKEVGTANTSAETFNTGNLKTFNDRIGTLNGQINSYNENEVKNANDGIAETNGLVQKQDEEISKIADLKTTAETAMGNANEKIDDIYGTNGEDGAIKKANDAIDAANTAIEALEGDGTDANKGKRASQLKDIEDAKEALEAELAKYDGEKAKYVKTGEESKTAQQWAQEAQDLADDASTNANAVLNAANDQETLNLLNDAKDTSKDALGRLLLNKDANYSVKDELANAKTDLTRVRSEVDTEKARLNGEIDRYNGLIAAEDKKLTGDGTAANPGLTKQKEDVDKEIADLENEQVYKDYKQAISDRDAAQKIMDQGKGIYILFYGYYYQDRYDNAKKARDAAQTIINDYAKTDNSKNHADATTRQSSLQSQIDGVNKTKQGYQNEINNIGDDTKGLIKAQNDKLAAQEAVLAEKQSEMNQVNAFEFNTANTFTIDLKDIESIKLQDEEAYKMLTQTLTGSGQYMDIFDQLKKDFGSVTVIDKNNMEPWKQNLSFKMIDSDTSLYKDVNSGVHIITTVFPYTDGWYEKKIEDKYEASWWNEHFNDNNIEKGLEDYTNYQCVVVCTDFDKLSVIRATFADAKVQAAKTVAEAAKAKADAAKDKVKDLSKIEKDAIDKYNELKDDLKDAEETINNLPVLTKYSDDDKIKDPKLTKYEKTEDGKSFKAIATLKNTKVDAYKNTDGTDKTIAARANTEVAAVEAVKVGEIAARKEIKIKVGDKEFTYKAGDVSITELQKLLDEARGMVAEAKAAVATASTEREAAQKSYEDAQNYADEADRVAKAAASLASRIKPAEDNDDPGIDDRDNPDDDDDSSSDGPGAGTGTIVASAGTIPVIPLPATAAGVAGARTGRRTSRSGVAGVRVDSGEGDGDANGEGDAAKNVVEPKAVASTNGKDKNAAGADKKFVKLENNEVPLADTPFEEGFDANWLWLLLAVAIVIIGVYTYERRKKAVANADEVKKYKKN